MSWKLHGCVTLNDASLSQVRRLPNGNQEVGVHIADVTNFLAPGTPMDKEAAARCFHESSRCQSAAECSCSHMPMASTDELHMRPIDFACAR